MLKDNKFDECGAKNKSNKDNLRETNNIMHRGGRDREKHRGTKDTLYYSIISVTTTNGNT